MFTDTGSGGRRRSRRLNTLQIKQLQDGEEIHTALTNAPDPAAFQVSHHSDDKATYIHVAYSCVLRIL